MGELNEKAVWGQWKGLKFPFSCKKPNLMSSESSIDFGGEENH